MKHDYTVIFTGLQDKNFSERGTAVERTKKISPITRGQYK